MNSTLKVTQNQPYIEKGGAKCFGEMRRLIREPLEPTCVV